MTAATQKKPYLGTTLRYLVRPVPVQFEPLFRRFEKSLERLVAALLAGLLLPGVIFVRLLSGDQPLPAALWAAGAVLPMLILFFVRVPHRHQSGFYNAGHALTVLILIVSNFQLSIQRDHWLGPALLYALVLLFQIIRPGRFKALAVGTILLIPAIYSLIAKKALLHPDQIGILLLIIPCAVLFHTAFHYLSLRFVELEQHRIREGNELDLARKVHESLFPAFSGNERIRIFKYHLPENQIGGDFYDLVFLREGNLGIFLSDISGHGISSAMMSTALKVVLSRIPYRNRLSPSALLTSLDKTMSESYESHHATGVYIFFDFLNSSVLLGNAGHPPVLLGRKGHSFQEIETSGSLIGMGIREPTADEVHLKMQTGDRYLLYTDGLLEYETIYGTISFVDDLDKLLEPLKGLPSNQMLDSMMESIRNLPDFLRFRDDVLVLVAEIQ